jgi:hypothetical protein
MARPWPSTGLTTQRWIAEVPLQWVHLGDLELTQEVNLSAVLRYLQGRGASHSGDEHIHVVKWRDALYIEDGHTRVGAMLIQGRDCARARVYDMDMLT